MKNQRPESHSSAKKIIFLTVFIDLIGFGIYITLSPFIAKYFEASALQIGWLMSIYSIMQFIFAPIWGKLSDRYGRRPILLLSLLGGSLSYLAMAFAPNLWFLFICRAVAGVFAANISTAHAYMADITTEKDRASGMGLIGAAFGIGFIIGPTLGSAFGYAGKLLGDQPPFGIFFPSLMAFLITFLNFVWADFSLPETLNHGEKTVAHHEPLRWWRGSFGTRTVNRLIFVFFVTNVAMPLMEVMLFPFVADRFGWGLMESGVGFGVVGLMMALTQGLLVRRFIPLWGERRTLMLGLAGMTIAFAMISVATSIPWLAVAMTFLAVGNGFVRPSLLGMVSLLTSAKDQGAVMGSSQSAASLGRIIGPVVGGWLYSHYSMGSPFLAAACFTVIGIFALILEYSFLPDQLSERTPA
ncbi:MAG: MFS transporter [Bdellovibrionales bacterium]|nr:MFS transporter [Bdellovibrionales bacterium]